METQQIPKERRKLSKRLCLSKPQFPLLEHKLQVFHDHEVALSIKQMHLTKFSAADLTPFIAETSTRVTTRGTRRAGELRVNTPRG